MHKENDRMYGDVVDTQSGWEKYDNFVVCVSRDVARHGLGGAQAPPPKQSAAIY